jgi:membrane protease YdiL (CAAX protease family)
MIQSPARRTSVLFGLAILALVITGLAGGTWTALILANFKTGLRIPWAPFVMAAVIWAMWQYLNGRWAPRSTSAARHEYLRAKNVPARIWIWSFVAGALAIVSVAGGWIVLGQLVAMKPNALPSLAHIPTATLVLILIVASIVAPFSEEAAFRGYFQTALERNLRSPLAAVLLSSVVFAIAHLTQGFYWPKQMLYFLVGVIFGAIAYFTDSTLPALPVHIFGDLVMFIFVWPYDATRRLIRDVGADQWFWIHVAQVIVFAAFALLAYRRLASVSKSCRVAGENTSRLNENMELISVQRPAA